MFSFMKYVHRAGGFGMRGTCFSLLGRGKKKRSNKFCVTMNKYDVLGLAVGGRFSSLRQDFCAVCKAYPHSSWSCEESRSSKPAWREKPSKDNFCMASCFWSPTGASLWEGLRWQP